MTGVSEEPTDDLYDELVGLAVGSLQRLATALLVLAVLVGTLGLVDVLLLLAVAPWLVGVIVGVGYGVLVASQLRYRYQLRSVVARRDRLVEHLRSADDTATEASDVLERARPDLTSGSLLKRLRAGRRTWKELTAIPAIDEVLDIHEDLTGPSLRLVWWSVPALALGALAFPFLVAAWLIT